MAHRPLGLRVRGRAAALACAGVLAALAQPAAAQDAVFVRLGTGALLGVGPVSTIEIPVVVDLTDAGAVGVAALSIELEWDPDRVSYVATADGDFGSLEYNDTDAATGVYRAGLYNATNASGTFTMATLTFQGGADGLATLWIGVTAMGDENGTEQDAAAVPVNAIVCVGVTGLYGDVDGSDGIDVLDAQQIALYTVDLPVTDVTLVLGLGDVTDDGQLNIIDAQQVARHSIGLGTIGRIGQQSAACAEPALAAVSGDAQSSIANYALPELLVVEVTDADGLPLEGLPVAWTVTSGGGSITPRYTNTDELGQATASWTLGGVIGTQGAGLEAPWSSAGAIPFSATAEELTGGFIAGTVTRSDALLAAPPAPAVADASRVSQVSPKLVSAGLVAATASGPVTPVPLETEYAPGELIVSFDAAALGAPPVGSAQFMRAATAQATAMEMRQRLAPEERAGIVRVAGTSPAVHAARVQVDPARLDSVAASWAKIPGVRSVERNAIAHAFEHAPGPLAAAATLPDDPSYPLQSWHYNMMDLPRAWDLTTGSADVLVAVVDDGIRFDHPAMVGNLTSDGYDFVSNSPYELCAGGTIGAGGDEDGYDPNPTQPLSYTRQSSGCLDQLKSSGNHGLHVAATIGAAGNDAANVTGVNWTVQIRPVRVLNIAGSGTFYDIAQGVLYAAGLPADDGASGTVQAASAARVINMSLGGPASQEVMEDAITAAVEAGALVVVAAGNSATSDPAYPAFYENVLTVSAVGPDRVLASYSNFGSHVDIASPGGDLADGPSGNGFGVWSATWNYVSSIPAYDGWQGTSMATPHVAGVAALILAYEPALTADKLRARLLDYAVDIGAAGVDNLYGYGLVNAYNSLTQTTERPLGDVYARLHDAATGALLQTVPAGSGGGFQFAQRVDGGYLVYAGDDEAADGVVGLPGRRWGAFGGVTSPTTITVSGAGTHDASLTMGFPSEAEPNNLAAEAHVMVPNAYLFGLRPAGDADWVRLLVPASGTYTLETSGWEGACAFALEEDTTLDLYASDATTLLTGNDDINLGALNYCSRITAELNAGTYYVRVAGYDSFGGDRYRLEFREGS